MFHIALLALVSAPTAPVQVAQAQPPPSVYLEYQHNDQELDTLIKNGTLKDVIFYGCYAKSENATDHPQIFIKGGELQNTQDLLFKLWNTKIETTIFAAPCKPGESTNFWVNGVNWENAKIDYHAPTTFFEDGTWMFDAASDQAKYAKTRAEGGIIGIQLNLGK